MESGHYLDIGSHHPSRFSVTRHLYQRGWSGVNVEANSQLIPEFVKKRKRDINLWNAVGPQRSYNLTIFKEPAISTINTNWKNKFVKENQEIDRIETVPGITVREILEKYFKNRKCKLLTIDIEGADYEALKTINFKTLNKNQFPDWILLETEPPVNFALKTESVTYAIDHGYLPYLILPMSTLLKKSN
jgi:FkbM family methyltransferase